MSESIQNISAAELYAINFQSPEPKYYSLVPHILSHLTYDFVDPKTGEVTIKKLSLMARELYRVLKMAAGECGKSWRNTENLADLCGMSEGSVSNAKKELCQKFHQLDGLSLITITEKAKKTFKKTGEKLNGTDYHEITIINIWPHNNAFMATKKYQKQEAGSPHEPAHTAGSPHEPALGEAGSCGERNKNPNNKNPLFKEQQPTPEGDPVDSVSSVFSKKKEDCLSSDIAYCYEWLLKEGCPEKNCAHISKNFTRQDLKSAIVYLRNQLKKNKAKGKETENIWAYLQKILNERYWEKSSV